MHKRLKITAQGVILYRKDNMTPQTALSFEEALDLYEWLAENRIKLARLASEQAIAAQQQRQEEDQALRETRGHLR